MVRSALRAAVLLWICSFISPALTLAASPQEAVSDARAILRSLEPAPASTLSTAVTPSKGIAHYGAQLLSALIFNGPSFTTTSSASLLSPDLTKAVALIQDAASHRNPDAIFLLAEMNFHGNYTHPRNFTESFRRYEQLASLTGNSTAQHMLGFMYATGIGGAVKQDQVRAQLYYTFAAEGGNTRSQMVLGYRHDIGISTPKNCEQAVHYYRKVADKAIEYVRSGPPGGHNIIRDSYRIADDEGGVYGEGASVSSSGANARMSAPNSDQHASVEDVVEYLDLMSRKGDLKATYSLAKLHYDGSRGIGRDLDLAKKYFLEVARKVWPKKGKPAKDLPASTEKLAAKAAGYLGRMFLRGEGMPQDFERAKTWFKRGITQGDALSQYSMGIMYLNGHSVPRNTVKAAEYFAPAADQDLASAQVRLGALFLDQGDIATAIRYFDLAARYGHIEAYYYLADLVHQGLGRDKSCNMAATYYKLVSEKAELLVAAFKESNDAYTNGDTETALVGYMMAAEQGFESAQANVAYLIDKAAPRRFSSYAAKVFPLLARISSSSTPSMLNDPTLALLYFTRSAKQTNIDSTVKAGDYYLSGLGTPHGSADAEKAAACYQAAAESMQSAQAMWNLGWMHENGIGIEQDFHLAKRFYDQALETNKEAYLPVKLALAKLRVRSAWNTVSGGRVKGIGEEDSKPRPSYASFSDWLAAFLEADLDNRDGQAQRYDDDYGGMYDDDDWGAAGAMPGGDYDDIWDEMGLDSVIESLAIIVCAVALGFLVVLRRRRQDERERGDRERAAREGFRAPEGVVNAGPAGVVGGAEGEVDMNGGDLFGPPGEADDAAGLFPPPGDPAYPGWVAGGVGH